MKRFGFVVAVAMALTACTPDFVEQNSSSVLLRIVKVSSEAGEQEEESDFLLSDVTPNFNDNAVLTVEVLSKNPNTLALGSFNDVYLERYEVRYFRTDGRNQEGVDVPFRFTGALGTLARVNVETDVAFVVVRHQAKDEPPLRNLASVTVGDTGALLAGGANILTTIAEITIHGRTTSGHALTATGRLTVTFANFADAEPPPTEP
jgi:hypothetical protein